MHNITLIFTKHKECENCNSIELYKIIEKINPEIIFEELSHTCFDESYNQKSLITLETNAIKMYLQNYNLKHIPVDTYPLPKSYYNDIGKMYDKIFNKSYQLRNLMDNELMITREHGFKYINSNQYDEFFEEFTILKESTLNVINDENLFRISLLEKEMIENREHEILSNIYNYSKEHNYNQALLFIGAGHRKTIIKLIEKFEIQEEIKLNWSFYN